MKIKESEIKEIIRQALNEVSSSDIKELEAIVKELQGASKMHKGQSEQLAAASKMHKSQSERIDKIVKSVSKTEGKLTEKATGQYKVSPKVQMHWGMDKVVIISGNKRVVLNRKEMKSLMKGVKANKLTEEKNCGCGQTPCITYGKQEEDFGMAAKQLPSFSSKEAKTIIDSSIRQYATLLRKAEAKIIKDWLTKAKSGVLDYFDIVRGLETGDASRAYPFELRFLKGILDRDKIMNRFRSYFKGKKGKKR